MHLPLDWFAVTGQSGHTGTTKRGDRNRQSCRGAAGRRGGTGPGCRDVIPLATSSVLPALVLGRREASGLVWSLLMMGYGFMVALVIGGVVGANAFAPGGTPATVIAFLAALVGILGAFVATGLTLMGARAALQGARNS